MADNGYVQGIGGELIRKDNDVDTYKIRRLQNGSTYKALKNYYQEEEL